MILSNFRSWLLVSAVALSGCGPMLPGAARLTPEQRSLNARSFEQVWTTIRDKHWDPDLDGLDWPGVRDELMPRVEKAGTMSEARRLMGRALARLDQSHFAILPAEVYADIEEPQDDATADGSLQDASDAHAAGAKSVGAAGLQVRVLGGQAVVTVVDDGLPGAGAGIEPGWAILKIDGVDVAPMISRITRSYGDSTLLDSRLTGAIAGRLRGRPGDSVELQMLDREDRRVSREISLAPPRGTAAKLGHLPAMHVWFESERIAGDIGIIAFNAFLDPLALMSQFGEAVQSCLQCQGMIIDLRGNGGGIGAMAMGMAGWFVDTPKQQLGTMYTRNGKIRFVIFPRPQVFNGPLAILVDGLSASTAEIFAGGLQALGRARVFGTPTAGAALLSVVEKLPNGDGFQYAFANYVSADGAPLEGRGVIPDVAVTPTRAALAEGRDPIMEAAVAWIQTQP